MYLFQDISAKRPCQESGGIPRKHARLTSWKGPSRDVNPANAVSPMAVILWEVIDIELFQTIKHTSVQQSFLERWCVNWLNVSTAVIFIILHKMVAKNCQAVHYTFKAAFVALGRPLLLGACSRVWHSSIKWTSARLNVVFHVLIDPMRKVCVDPTTQY